MSKLKLANKKNPRKHLEEIASCKVKYGVPVSDSKKVAQLIRLDRKKYGTVITVTQMCKKSRKLLAPQSKLWTRCGNNEESKAEKIKGEENAGNEEETTLSKKGKGKDCSKEKDDKGKKKK